MAIVLYDYDTSLFFRSVQNSRHCFVENAKKQNFLEDPEYQTLSAWFEYSEKHLDINLDLIGKYNLPLVHTYRIVKILFNQYIRVANPTTIFYSNVKLFCSLFKNNPWDSFWKDDETR